MLKVLLMLIGFDVVMGLTCGLVYKDLNSRVGLIGLIKHSTVILIVLAFKYITTELNYLEYLPLMMIFYIIQYSLSILENAYCLGVPVPKILLVRLRDYQESEGLEKWEK